MRVNPTPARLRVCIIDMNNGLPNQAIRCIQRIMDQFLERVRAANPSIDAALVRVEPRNLGDLPPADCDLYLSSGGPGAPFEGYDEPWCTGYRKFLDSVVDETVRQGAGARAVFLVCHSFEIAVLHFGVARIAEMPQRKFGIQPVYPTRLGQRSALLEPFGDRLFSWENRGWKAVEVDARRLSELGGELWARESREGKRDKGDAALAMLFAHGLEGVQFHPEADRDGAAAWLYRPDKAQETIEAFGEATYHRMLRTLEAPERLPRTFAVMIPSWLVRRFNTMAPSRGWSPIPVPCWTDRVQALSFFGARRSLPPARPGAAATHNPGETMEREPDSTPGGASDPPAGKERSCL